MARRSTYRLSGISVASEIPLPVAPLDAARADLCRRLGRVEEARAAYGAALARVKQPAERRFLEGRLAALGR